MDEHIPLLKPSQHELVMFLPNGGSNVKLVYVACATTAFLGQDGELCQLAAKAEDEERVWSTYILPEGDFVPQASSYNGFTITMGVDGERQLLKDGIKVETISIKEAIASFVAYITEKARDSGCITALVGWNSQQFHVPLLLRALKQCGFPYKDLERVGICYSDPYLMVRKSRDSYPLLAQAPNLKLPDIYRHLHGSSSVAVDAHCSVLMPRQGSYSTIDAHSIVMMLQSVMSSLEISKEQLKSCSFTLKSAEHVRLYQRKVNRNLRSITAKLVKRDQRDGITASMANKIAKSGLKLKHLKQVYRKGGREGLVRLLSEPPPQKGGSDRPRVTKCKRVIEKIVSLVEQL